ncbi:MAG: AAA family ATPase [Acidimicrobiia bacterium]|nr:AAA family ATPase [Acidimicrobiia bacterium]
MSSTIVLANSSVAFEQRLRRSLKGDFEGTVQRWENQAIANDPHRAVKELMEYEPDIVAIGPSGDLSAALELCWAFQNFHPEVETVIVTEPNGAVWRKALRSGASDVMNPKAEPGEVIELFERLLETSTRRRLNLMQGVGGGSSGGRIVTVVAPKGGTGKTALATNMAVGLASMGHQRVVLVDLDLQFGDVADALQLRPESSIADVSQSGGAVSPTSLKALLVKRGENLFALAAPANPADGEDISASDVEDILHLLAEEFDVVVVDTSAGITEATLSSIEVSSDLMLVCDLSVSSVRGLRKVVDTLDRLEILKPKRHFILNRADSRVGVTVDDASAVVGMPVAVAIPSARDVPLSMNQGIPVIEAAPRTQVARRYLEAAAIFSVNGQAGNSAAPKRGLLARLRGDNETE